MTKKYKNIFLIMYCSRLYLNRVSQKTFLILLTVIFNFTTFFSATNDWQHAAKLFFIENQIKICEAINSPGELQHWYSVLGAHLASHGTEPRIRTLLDKLLGPTHYQFKTHRIAKRYLVRFNNLSYTFSNSIFYLCELQDIDSHDIMENILDHLKREPRWQRLYMEYAEQLELGRKIITADGTEIDFY